MIKRGKNPISKVVFYEIEMNGEKIREAAIFRKDGVYIEDKEIGIDALYELAKENGCKTMSEFETSNYFEVLSEENLKNKYPNIYQVAKNGEEDLELSSETETKDQNFDENENKVKNLQKLLDKFHIKKFMAKTSIYLLAGGFALFGGINLGKKLYNKAVNSKTKSQKEENSKFDYITTEQKLDDINSTENETATDMLEKYGSVDEILKQSNINQTKSTRSSDLIGIPLKKLSVRKGALVAIILHKGKVIVPFGDDTIDAGDNVVIISTASGISDLNEVIKK